MAVKPNPSLAVEITAPNGAQSRWDPDSPFPQDVPIDPQFSTASGEGHTNASVTLNRPVNQDYTEIGLLNRFRLIGASGTVAYDGRISGAPKGSQISVEAYGWSAHATQRPFTDFIVDRDKSQWGESALAEQARLAGFGYSPNSAPSSTDDYLAFQIDRLAQAGATGHICLCLYQAPGDIGEITFNVSALLGGNWTVNVGTGQSPNFGTGLTSFSTQLGPFGTYALLQNPTAGAEFAFIHLFFAAAFTGDSPSWKMSAKPIVWGKHALPRITRPDTLQGVAASDAIKWLAGKYAPKLDVSKVEQTTYGIPQIVWRDPTNFMDAARQLNSYHGWKLGVWDDAELVFGPYDYTKADWQVKNGVNGVRVEPQGDTTADVFNGCVVNYTDLTGVARRLTPDDAAELRDTNENIAANQWGEQIWMELGLSWIMSSSDAAMIGSIALAEANRAKRPTTITVPAHIQDINGVWHPSWEVRSDQTIAVLNQSSPTPRLITSTSWQNHELTISTDNTIDTLQAVQERIATALGAAGIGS